MKDGYKKVWITLLILIVCAAGIGFFYWAGQKRIPDDEGMLVYRSEEQAVNSAGFVEEERKEEFWQSESEIGKGVTVYGI